ncbi:hypothetical protein ONZ45_g12898 [Pleurotus djamor]|nr:hypothetical protein ONZ45_g12898 [Pleurotus djamor]
MRGRLASLLTLTTLAASATEQVVLEEANLTSSQCCEGLRSVISPSQVHLSSSDLYTTQQSTYYSGEQASQRPACRVTPVDANDVSFILKFATRHQCEFAVRAGGHMSWAGSSNIGPEGFTIDLENMRKIGLLDDSKTVSIEPGLRWSAVYNFLVPHGLHTVGGRSSGVGVGGFLMGGGVSFLSPEYGFGSDNVINYEVVLSDGSIVNANEAEHTDLYWALKGGSTNYGIVTKFDMPTHRMDQMWGGSLFYNISMGGDLLKYLVGFTERLDADPQGMSAYSLVFNPITQDYAIWSPNVYLQPKAYPSPLFDGLKDFEPLLDTTRITNLVDITDEVDRTNAGGARSQWSAFVFKANGEYPWDAFLHGKEFFAEDVKRPGVFWAITVQPINTGMIRAGAKRGGNPFGLSVDDGNHFLLLFSTFWMDPADDDVMKAKTQEFIEWLTTTGTERGLLHRFIYMDYALDTQPVLQSFGEENYKRMKEIKEKYDPDNLLRLWKGGWKL